MPFREMRRKKQQLSEQESCRILQQSTSGVLCLLGDEGYPYAVPMSYVYSENALYFHSADAGHKVDAVRRWEKASFCVIERDEIVPEKFTTRYRSVIVFGQICVVQEADEIRQALEALADKYSPGCAGKQQEIDRSVHRVCILKLTVAHMTGKEGLELLHERQAPATPS
ncbi:MAG: pyridoxamine 5'-phosphate oxidase family protein [Eubacteriales bacterium]|nr:pyridoxamine 5'-phosphate oxidase family protein [Eubacteriales bacterium]